VFVQTNGLADPLLMARYSRMVAASQHVCVVAATAVRGRHSIGNPAAREK
jgi:hypothetical protein